MTNKETYQEISNAIANYAYDNYFGGLAEKQQEILALLSRICSTASECAYCGNDCSSEKLINLIKGSN
jgi:3-deoxy-D-manno-octulosonate 8-phosphate phosphatase KdsC-like HAD superfamily phosphatase